MAVVHVRRQRGTALAAVAAAHAGLFLLLAFGLRPSASPLEREVAVVPVYLVESRRNPRKPRPAQSPPRIPAIPARPALDLPPMPAPPASEPQSASAPAPPDEDAERARLAGVLRASRVGCANPALLTERERVRCEDRLAAGAATAKYIPTPLPPERRAYYDAIAKAKQPPQPAPMAPYKTPPPTAGSTGSLAALQARNEKVRIPLGGCKIAFGPGSSVKKPPHGVKLGPMLCSVPIPQGPLTVEADIQNPDKVVKGKD